ncbi:hypothetical protein BJ546DRAFT_270012 [Cryomyces antarcticus]|uniref:DUF6536 domain-containing protein n=1 Tax=Cryomyces antarcticus TaxID=329879 RepID=A0ABR0LZH1_9PEZI|nr:hypothetical protein LTR39_000761 [Cryomyces antarcticus]KAK5020368.1 hypothetical protein LTR60_000579 [Cryomyces antarcticus]KAK5257256.1 hypothetical protein LTR16_001182 [Cryomyces antarcticus]
MVLSMMRPTFPQRPKPVYSEYSMLQEPPEAERTAGTSTKAPSGEEYELMPRDGRHERAQGTTPSIGRRYLAGWRFGLLRAALTAAVAFIVNTSVDAWMFRVYGRSGGSGVVFQGTCSAVETANVLIHLALNILSTLLLSASNYCMQGLSAPTRAEVDKAHAKRRWVDVGISSIRNLRSIGRARLILWSLLAGTSVLIHLFFNSVFFTTRQTHQYAVAVVSADYFNNTAWTPTCANTTPELFPHNSASNPYVNTSGCPIPNILSNATSFERLDTRTCLEEYARGFVQGISNVVVVTATRNSTDPLLWSRWPEKYISGHDIPDSEHFHYGEGDRCDPKVALKGTNDGINWTVYGHPVDYCLSQPVVNVCKLQYNVWMMLGVVLFGGIKTVTMAWMVFKLRVPSLRTVGDAVASFLSVPDQSTTDMCLVSTSDLRKHGWSEGGFPPQVYTGLKLRWWRAMSNIQWWLTHALAILFVIILGTTLPSAIGGAHDTEFSNGLGVANVQSMAYVVSESTSSRTIVPTLLVANLPQLGFSVVYLAYNGLFTKMLLADEWGRFAVKHTSIRVSSSPLGAQRETGFLSLPTRYALPLMTFSALVHWLLSQSLFIVRIDDFDSTGEQVLSDTISRLGYSVIGIVSVMSLTLTGAIVTMIIGLSKRLPTAMPGDGSNSAVISAACHPHNADCGYQFAEVKWGEVPERGGADEVAHCSLSGGTVEEPEIGRLYK